MAQSNLSAAQPESRHSGKPFVFALIVVILLGFATVAFVRSRIVSIEGVYSLEVCAGKGEGPFCEKGVAHLKAGKIAADAAADGSFTLEGDLTPGGDATFRLNLNAAQEKGAADLKGALRDGHLSANGTFPDGKAAFVSMEKAGA